MAYDAHDLIMALVHMWAEPVGRGLIIAVGVGYPVYAYVLIRAFLHDG